MYYDKAKRVGVVNLVRVRADKRRLQRAITLSLNTVTQ